LQRGLSPRAFRRRSRCGSNVTATFQTLASGLTYMAYAEIAVPTKQLSVQVQNFDYTRPN
jgi:hypothetical protein